MRGNAHPNSMGSVWVVLERSIHGAWHHVLPKHLEHYVIEVTFRLNESNCEVDTIGCIGGKRLSSAGLIADSGKSTRVLPA